MIELDLGGRGGGNLSKSSCSSAASSRRSSSVEAHRRCTLSRLIKSWRRDLRPLGERRASFSVSEFAKTGRVARPSDREQDDIGLRVELIKSTAERKSSFDITAERYQGINVCSFEKEC